LTLRFSAFTNTEPARCMIVVDMPSRLSFGISMTEFGETSMLSSPRTSSSIPFSPVRTVCPGRTSASLVSDTGCGVSEEEIQNSPTPST